MKIAVMQPYIFPYLGYFQLINSVNTFVLFDDVNFINKGWINRNRILVNKSDYLFTIPLSKASQNKLIHEIELTQNLEWKAKFMKTVENAYKKAPNFSSILPIINKIIYYENSNLSNYIFHSIKIISEYLNISTQILPSSAPYNTSDLKGQDKILSICKQENAVSYINPIGGIEIYNNSKFEKNGINLFFLKPEHFVYKQFNNNFVPWLSIIDVLMFNSKSDCFKMLNKYSLVKNA